MKRERRDSQEAYGEEKAKAGREEAGGEAGMTLPSHLLPMRDPAPRAPAPALTSPWNNGALAPADQRF